MKKHLSGSIAAFLLLILSPAASANVIHLWSCQLHADSMDADIEAWSSEWLAAANQLEGGKDLEVYVEYPLAASVEDGTFTWVLVAPDAATWGTYEDAYEGSKAEELDAVFITFATCSSNTLWRSVKIE